MGLLIKHKVFGFDNKEYDQMYVHIILYRISKENSELLVRVMYHDSVENGTKAHKKMQAGPVYRAGVIEPKIAEECGCPHATNFTSLPYNFYYSLVEEVEEMIENRPHILQKFNINIVGDNLYEYSYNKLKESFKKLLPMAEIIDV